MVLSTNRLCGCVKRTTACSAAWPRSTCTVAVRVSVTAVVVLVLVLLLALVVLLLVMLLLLLRTLLQLVRSALLLLLVLLLSCLVRAGTAAGRILAVLPTEEECRSLEQLKNENELRLIWFAQQQ